MRTVLPPIFIIPAWVEVARLKTVMPTEVRAVRSAGLEFSMVAPMAVEAHSEGAALGKVLQTSLDFGFVEAQHA